jgi:hypothetical protein
MSLMGTNTVRSTLLTSLFLIAPLAQAKGHPSYERGKLLSMDSVSCGYAEKQAKSVAGEILGTDSAHKKTQEVLCQEYVLQGEHIQYRIRPRDEKHPALLPVGEVAEFRITKDKLVLRVPEGDGKEREYAVVSMTQHNDDSKAPATVRAGN